MHHNKSSLFYTLQTITAQQKSAHTAIYNNPYYKAQYFCSHHQVYPPEKTKPSSTRKRPKLLSFSLKICHFKGKEINTLKGGIMSKFDKKHKNITEEALDKYKRGQIKSDIGTHAKTRDEAVRIDIKEARKKGIQVAPEAPKDKPTKHKKGD
jgi:hypothetical protein